jgi:hypothetical protein
MTHLELMMLVMQQQQQQQQEVKEIVFMRPT